MFNGDGSLEMKPDKFAIFLLGMSEKFSFFSVFQILLYFPSC